MSKEVDMTNEELIIGLGHIAHTMERNGHSYYQHVAEEAIKVLEQQPKSMEKFDDVKTHIQRLAGDYKCWDNRLTWEEALELNRMLEAQSSEDYINRAYIESIVAHPKTGRCKDCKYFEYDTVAKMDGMRLIVAHEICRRWGDGCKTKENGYCFLFEPQESEDKE